METEKTPIRSASLAEARRHESGSRWLEASRAYLNALVSSPELTDIALAGLKRCASRTSKNDDHSVYLSTTQVILIIGHLAAGQWIEARELCHIEEGYVPTKLSLSMRERWHVLQHRLETSLTEEANPEDCNWIALLQILDILTVRGFISDAMMMCRSVVGLIANDLHRALACFEAGRIGLKSQHYFTSAYLLTEAVDLAPDLEDDVEQVLDEQMIEFASQLPDFSDLSLFHQLDTFDELITIRCRQQVAENIEIWVDELCSDEQLQGAASFYFWLALRLEYLAQANIKADADSPYMLGSFLAYALTLNKVRPQTEVYQYTFSRLVYLTLARKLNKAEHLDDDASTIDSQPPLDQPRIVELIDGGESRLLLQLREQKQEELIFFYYQQKAEANHLSPTERAKAYNTLAQSILDNEGSLQQAVEYAQLGANLAANEIRLSRLIRVARDQDNWQALGPLLKIQLNLTKQVGKRLIILSTIAQGYRQQSAWFEAYQTLIQAGAEETVASSSNTEPDHVNPFLMTFSEAIEKEITSLLKVKGAALHIGEELSVQERWSELNRLLERLGMKGKVAIDLLTRASNQATYNWSFVQPLLDHYRNQEAHEQFLQLVLTAPKSDWPRDEYGILLKESIDLALSQNNEYHGQILKLQAEWLEEIGSTSDELMLAWHNYLELHPADLNALEALEQTAETASQWNLVAQAYEKALPLRKTGKIRILNKLCQIYKRTEDLAQLIQAHKMILELDSSHDEAGAWLTLHYAEEQSWYQVLLICALWTPETALHPVWTEAKVRAHLGLEELDAAYYWWTQLGQESVRRLFVVPLLRLAETQRHGDLVLNLLELMENFEYDAFQSLSEFDLTKDTSTDDVPPPLTHEQIDLLEQSVSDDEFHLDTQTIVSESERTKLRAKALYLWVKPKDLLRAVVEWESLILEHPDDLEACYALVDLYSQLGRKKSLINHLAFVELGAEVTLPRRQAVILGALQLETRFQEYTEAFKCWLSLYEHSAQDREHCLASFYRLADQDRDLAILLQELLKLRSEHSTSKMLSTITLLDYIRLSHGKMRKHELAYEATKQVIYHPIYKEEAQWYLLRSCLPLGRWEETIKILDHSTSWRTLSVIAQIAECRLGNSQLALDLYQRAKVALIQSSSVLYSEVEKLPQYLDEILNKLELAIERVTSQLTSFNKTEEKRLTLRQAKLGKKVIKPAPASVIKEPNSTSQQSIKSSVSKPHETKLNIEFDDKIEGDEDKDTEVILQTSPSPQPAPNRSLPPPLPPLVANDQDGTSTDDELETNDIVKLGLEDQENAVGSVQSNNGIKDVELGLNAQITEVTEVDESSPLITMDNLLEEVSDFEEETDVEEETEVEEEPEVEEVNNGGEKSEVKEASEAKDVFKLEDIKQPKKNGENNQKNS